MKKYAGILSIFLIAILCAACNGTVPSTEEPVRTQFFAMDTSMTFTAYGKGAEAALMPLVSYDKVRIDGNRILLSEEMELDLGAVGKGYAGDLAAELLRKNGITSALLDIGGNIQAVGSRPDGSNWKLGIRNPFGEGSLGVLEISDKAVVTSGAYERYFVGEDGKEYGHILNPATGYPADNELAAVTIIAEEGKQGDALSTALFVKGLEGAKAYWQEHGDFEMLLVTKNGELYLTEGVEGDFSISGNLANRKIHVLNRL